MMITFYLFPFPCHLYYLWLGHNGLRDIDRVLQSSTYAKLGVGIGRGNGKKTLQEHVLNEFSATEEIQLNIIFEQMKSLTEKWME